MSSAREEAAMAAMYDRVVRKPREGTMSAAIRVHAQACGFVAYALDTHPDIVARAVADERRRRDGADTPTHCRCGRAWQSHAGGKPHICFHCDKLAPPGLVP